MVAAREAAAHQPRLSMAATTLVKARPRREMHALLHQKSQDTQPNPNRTKNPNTHWLLKDCWVNAFLWTRLPRTHPEIKARIIGRKSAAL